MNKFESMDAQNAEHRMTMLRSDEVEQPNEVVPTQPYPMTEEERAQYEIEYNRYLDMLRIEQDAHHEELVYSPEGLG